MFSQTVQCYCIQSSLFFAFIIFLLNKFLSKCDWWQVMTWAGPEFTVNVCHHLYDFFKQVCTLKNNVPVQYFFPFWCKSFCRIYLKKVTIVVGVRVPTMPLCIGEEIKYYHAPNDTNRRSCNTLMSWVCQREGHFVLSIFTHGGFVGYISATVQFTWMRLAHGKK